MYLLAEKSDRLHSKDHMQSSACIILCIYKPYLNPNHLSFSDKIKFKLKGFYHIWAVRPSWSCDQDHLSKLLFPYPKESQYEISVQLAQWFQRKRSLKMLTDGQRTDERRTPESLVY